MKLLAIAVALLAVAGAPRETEACSCSGPRAVVYPKTGPTNAHIFVWIPTGTPSEHMSPLALKAPGASSRIDVDEMSVVSGELRFVEIAPRAALSPRTTYDVVDAANKVIGQFATGDGALAEKIEWQGLARGELVKIRDAGGGSCRWGGPHIRLTVGTVPKDALFAVWVAGVDGKLDYAKDPTTFGSVRNVGGGQVILGRTSLCSSDNFAIPRGARIKIGVKLVGETGARSAPSELMIDLTKPREID